MLGFRVQCSGFRAMRDSLIGYTGFLRGQKRVAKEFLRGYKEVIKGYAGFRVWVYGGMIYIYICILCSYKAKGSGLGACEVQYMGFGGGFVGCTLSRRSIFAKQLAKICRAKQSCEPQILAQTIMEPLFAAFVKHKRLQWTPCQVPR